MASNNRGGNRGGGSNRGGNRGRNNNPEGRNQYSSGVMDIARERPVTAALGAAGLVGAGVFLWSRRNQISDQLSNLSDQIGEWTENMRSSGSDSDFDDTAGLTSSGSTGSSNNMGTTSRSSRSSAMSETGGGNSSLGASSGGSGTTGSASGRGRARSTATS